MPVSDKSPAAPSGEQHRISDGTQVAVVTEVGAALRSYTAGRGAVLDGFEERDIAHDGRGQVLAPWPNRLGDGRYQFEGITAQAPINEISLSNAIHGLVRWLPWQAVRQSPDAVMMTCTLHPQPGYPWRLLLEVEYRLESGGLSVSATATNESETPAPFGIGFHPYLTAGTPTVDVIRLRLDAERCLVADERGLPTGTAEVAGTDLDFRVGRSIGSTRLDTVYLDLARGDDGLAKVDLDAPGGAGVSLWMDEHFPYVMVYSADHVGSHVRGSIAIEPMSCPPDALRSGTGVARLVPGSSWRGHWGISPR